MNAIIIPNPSKKNGISSEFIRLGDIASAKGRLFDYLAAKDGKNSNAPYFAKETAGAISSAFKMAKPYYGKEIVNMPKMDGMNRIYLQKITMPDEKYFVDMNLLSLFFENVFHFAFEKMSNGVLVAQNEAGEMGVTLYFPAYMKGIEEKLLPKGKKTAKVYGSGWIMDAADAAGYKTESWNGGRIDFEADYRWLKRTLKLSLESIKYQDVYSTTITIPNEMKIPEN